MCPGCPASPSAGGESEGRSRLSRRGLMGGLSALAITGALVGSRSRSEASGASVRLAADAEPITGSDGQLAAPAPARSGVPSIASCDDWNARNPSKQVKIIKQRPVKILVHHTATANRSEVGEDDLVVLAKSIQDFHMDTNGWIDSGHHFLVNRGGLIAEGRHQSLATLLGRQWMIEGTHCPDQNDIAVGIENQGTYTEVNPPAALYSSLRSLCVYVCQQYGIEADMIYGHRDFRDTACPGDKLYGMLPQLRSEVAQQLGKATEGARLAMAAPTWPLLRPADTGPRVLAAQHLLRAAGMAGVPADGTFGASTSQGVLAFQTRNNMERTGMIAGGSWPLLAVDVRPGQGGEADLAAQALLHHPNTQAPAVIDRPTWQRLLA